MNPTRFAFDKGVLTAHPTKSISRRRFLKTSISGGLSLGLAGWVRGAERASELPGRTDPIGVGVIGLGGIGVVGGVGGRGRQLIAQLRKIPQAKIVALCDLDAVVLEEGVQEFKGRGETVKAYPDLRQLLEDKAVEAVIVATPNHWHALATIWACQAGKDVYVEKPFSHDVWEGRQMVAAARKYQRIVQVGTQSRSSTRLQEGFDYIHSGQIGAIRVAHALVYRPRESIGAVNAPVPAPATVDYDLWCGPAEKLPLYRKQLHYEWHWFWNTGNGELGNNGVHVIDICRWALRQETAPARVMSIGGRFGFDDRAETPNTQIAFFDYKPAPLICEIRNLGGGAHGIGQFRNADHGVIIECEGGSLVGDSSAVAILDKLGKKIKDIQPTVASPDIEAVHLKGFFAAVRSRQASDLAAEAEVGHVSATCCHLGNISHRVGSTAAPETIQEAIRTKSDLAEAFDRCREYLSDHGMDLHVKSAVLGASLTFDPVSERFVGELAEQANRLTRRECREPFVIPKIS